MKNREKMQLPLVERTSKAVGTLGVIILLSAIIFPVFSFAYTETEVSGVFDGTSFFIPCSLIPSVDPSDGLMILVSTTTGTTYGFASGSYGYVDLDSRDFCASEWENNFVPSTPLGDINTILFEQPADTYYFSVIIKPDEGAYVDGDRVYLAFDWDGVAVTGYEYYTAYTHFIYTEPEYGEYVSTSTPVALRGYTYINQEDYSEDMYLRIKYVRQQDLQASVANTDLLWTTIDFPSEDEGGDPLDIVTWGYSYLSTTTTFTNEGLYYLEMEVRKSSWVDNVLSWWSLDGLYDRDVLISTSSQFIVGQMTAYDAWVASSTASFDEFVASSTLTFEQAKNACWSLSGFDFSDCLFFLFGWQEAPMRELMTEAREGVFRYAPFGYITRGYEIMATTSTSTLPILSYTFDEDFPVDGIAGANFHFDPWDYFYKDGAPVKDDLVTSGGKDVWEIFEPLIKLIVYLTLFFMIIKELLQIRLAEGNFNHNL